MLLILCWLIGLPKLLYHFFLTSILLILFLIYKLFGKGQTATESRVQLQAELEQKQRSIVARSGLLKRKIKCVIMKGARGMLGCIERKDQLQGNGCIINKGSKSNLHNNNNPIYGKRSNVSQQFYLSSLALVCVMLLFASQWTSTRIYCLEQDAEVLMPVATLAKAMIKTVTLGVPLEVDFNASGIIKNFAYFTWRTGFPVKMPSGFMQKALEFYNRVKLRVDQAEVAEVERKSLANLKLDLDKIVDSIVEEVRQSPDGLYTDYLQTRVDGLSLEDACTAVGIQLKAYGVDLSNYRNIAGMVLGIPVMPTVASAMMNVVKVANMDTVRNLTGSLNPLNSSIARHLPDSALHSVSVVSETALHSIDNLRHQLPLQNIVQTPLSLLSSGQRLLTVPPVQGREPQPLQLQQAPVFA